MTAGYQQSLKFWDPASSCLQAGTTAPYILNTRADTPHHGPITDIAFHPTEPMVATTSEDGEFKVWARRAGSGHHYHQQQQQKRPLVRWRCRSVGSYKRRPLGACAFSADGSLLAVAGGCTATLWDPYSNALVAVMPAPGAGHTGQAEEHSSGSAASSGVEQQQHSVRQLTQLVFSSCSPHLAGLVTTPGAGGGEEGLGSSSGMADSALVVWDLLTLSVAWSCTLPNGVSLSSDPTNALFAVGINFYPRFLSPEQQQQPQQGEQQQEQQQQSELEAQQLSRAQKRAQRRGCILVFSPSSPMPLYTSVLPPGPAISRLLHIAPGTQLGAGVPAQKAVADAAPLLVVTEDRYYAVVVRPRDAAAPAGAPAASAALVSELGAKESMLEAVFGNAAGRLDIGATAQALASSAAVDERVASRRVASLFDAPSHLLLPPSKLCSSLLELLVDGGDQGSA